MNKQRVLDTFLDLVAINSPSQHESAMAAYCAKRLEQLDFSVRFDRSKAATGSDTNQIIAFRPGTAPGHIALSAHMDCVQPCLDIEPRIDDGIIHTDGSTTLSGDDKSGVAEIFEAVQSAGESDKPCPDVTVLLSVCEERGVGGAPNFPDQLFDDQTLCLVLDAEGPAGTIFTAAPHHYAFRATFRGRAAHAGSEPEQGLSAIQMAALAIERMPLGRIDDQTTASVGTIQGGTARNIVPDVCVVVGECRSLDPAADERMRQNLDRALHEGAREFGGTVDVDWTLLYPDVSVPADDPDVKLLQRAAKRAGLTPRLAVTGSGSDANVLAPKGAKPIPIACGTVGFHSLRESLPVRDLQNCALFVEEIILETASAR